MLAVVCELSPPLWAPTARRVQEIQDAQRFGPLDDARHDHAAAVASGKGTPPLPPPAASAAGSVEASASQGSSRAPTPPPPPLAPSGPAPEHLLRSFWQPHACQVLAHSLEVRAVPPSCGSLPCRPCRTSPRTGTGRRQRKGRPDLERAGAWTEAARRAAHGAGARTQGVLRGVAAALPLWLSALARSGCPLCPLWLSQAPPTTVLRCSLVVRDAQVSLGGSSAGTSATHRSLSNASSAVAGLVTAQQPAGAKRGKGAAASSAAADAQGGSKAGAAPGKAAAAADAAAAPAPPPAAPKGPPSRCEREVAGGVAWCGASASTPRQGARAGACAWEV